MSCDEGSDSGQPGKRKRPCRDIAGLGRGHTDVVQVPGTARAAGCDGMPHVHGTAVSAARHVPRYVP